MSIILSVRNFLNKAFNFLKYPRKPVSFFALSDEECWHAFGVEPRKGKPSYRYDDEVICTSYYSKLEPMENGEVQ